MPRPRTLLLVSCPTHGAGPCTRPSGCPERRALAGLPPLPPSSGTTGAERARRAAPLRAIRAALKAADDVTPEDATEACNLLRAAVVTVQRRAEAHTPEGWTWQHTLAQWERDGGGVVKRGRGGWRCFAALPGAPLPIPPKRTSYRAMLALNEYMRAKLAKGTA